MTIGQLPSIDPNPPPTSQPTSRLRAHWGLVVSVALGLVAYGGMLSLDARSGTLRDRFTSQTIGWYLLAFAGFALALWWNERHPIDRRWLWAVPIVFRILLLATTPTLSDDVHRYLWDGHVATEGVNPYSHAIDAPELDEYEIPARALANHPSLGTPYLPAAQHRGGQIRLGDPWPRAAPLRRLELGRDLVEVRQDLRGVHRRALALDRPLHGLLQHIGRAKQQLERLRGHFFLALAQLIEQVLHPMRDGRHHRVPHGGRHALDGMNGTKQGSDGCSRCGIGFPGEKLLIEGSEMLPALGKE